MPDTEQKKSGKVTRDFTDAGTDRRFAAGTTHEFTDGEFLNFHAAGLIEAPDAPAEKTVDAGEPAKPGKAARS
jgi:hypothetical protein